MIDYVQDIYKNAKSAHMTTGFVDGIAKKEVLKCKHFSNCKNYPGMVWIFIIIFFYCFLLRISVIYFLVVMVHDHKNGLSFSKDVLLLVYSLLASEGLVSAGGGLPASGM